MSAAVNEILGVTSGGSRPSAKDGVHLTMNVEFCEDNSGTSKKMHFFQKIQSGTPGPSPGSTTGNPAMDLHPIQGRSRHTPGHFMLQKTEIHSGLIATLFPGKSPGNKVGLIGHQVRMQTSP